MAAEAAARERDEKSHHNKRAREWEEEEVQGAGGKKPASDENRARLDDLHHHRPSPPIRMPSPHHQESRRRSSSERPGEGYHHGPSAPLHTPNSLPPMQLPPLAEGLRSPPPPPRISEIHREERKEIIEPAARKVELDEDYDNEEMVDADRGAAQVKENNSPIGNGTNGISGGPSSEN